MWILNPFSMRQAPSVAHQPYVELTDWHVIECQGIQRFLLGLLPGKETMRITTNIQTVDFATRTWITQSGRTYYTPGGPTSDAALTGEMRVFAKSSGIHGEIKDVSEELWTAMRRSIN